MLQDSYSFHLVNFSYQLDLCMLLITPIQLLPLLVNYLLARSVEMNTIRW